MNKTANAFQSTLRTYEASLIQKMPDSPYRDFHLWALDAQNQQQDMWSQVIGIPQFAKLTSALLGPLVTESEWAALTDYSALMNGYLIYETVSDNLAIGIEDQNKSPRIKRLQRQALYQFNNAMITCLEGDGSAPIHEMAYTIPVLDRLSTFEHSLTYDEQIGMARAFLSQRPDLEIEDLEYGVWAALIANIESCLEVKTALAPYQLGGRLRNGLTWRYQAVNRLFDAAGMPLPQLADVSTHAILVIPVLTYYVSVLSEIVRPTPLLNRVIEGNRLSKTIYSAALLVRLLNDLGTQLVMDDHQHSFLLHMLTERYEQLNGHQATLSDLLLDLSDDLAFLTRFRKDILYGEFNVCLNDLRHEICTPDTIAAFGQRLAYFCELYQDHRARMHSEAEAITGLMQDDLVSKLILSFVYFHENLYDHPFDSQTGDYATKPSISAFFHAEGQD